MISLNVKMIHILKTNLQRASRLIEPSSSLGDGDFTNVVSATSTPLSTGPFSTTGICAHDTARFFNYYPFKNYYARRLGYFDSAQHRFVLDNFLVS